MYYYAHSCTYRQSFLLLPLYLPPTAFIRFATFIEPSASLDTALASSSRICIGSRSCNTPSLTSLRLTPKSAQAFSYFVRDSVVISSPPSPMSSAVLYICYRSLLCNGLFKLFLPTPLIEFVYNYHCCIPNMESLLIYNYVLCNNYF